MMTTEYSLTQVAPILLGSVLALVGQIHSFSGDNILRADAALEAVVRGDGDQAVRDAILNARTFSCEIELPDVSELDSTNADTMRTIGIISEQQIQSCLEKNNGKEIQ